MCGICGVVWRPDQKIEAGASERVTRAMMAAMKHRGPDGEGVHLGQRVALGHLRLAVIDVESGAQPMSAPDGRTTLIFNGEIYNFQDLRPDLAARGWNFQTRSDTEVVLAGHVLEGDAADRRLNGMYAYARLEQTGGSEVVTLAIDPIGIKPLYVAETGSAIVFASELRGIIAALETLGETPELDEQAVAQYLALGWTPAPRTLLRGVRKIPRGGRLRIHSATGAIDVLEPQPLPAKAESATVEDLEAALRAAVRRQMISDVPLGFFLSGGVDSSLLVALAAEMGLEPLTFTVRFSGEGHGVAAANEADVARAVASHFSTRHHECEVTGSVLTESLDDALSAMDQPIADPACLPLLLLSRFAREQVTVCLSGDGGDELFAGYPRHQWTGWKQQWRGLPGAIRSPLRAASAFLPQAPASGVAEFLRRARVGFDLIDDENYFSGPFSGLRGRELDPQPELPDWARNVSYDGDKMLEADFAGELVGQMLPKTDHVSMSASLECRVPLLDLEVVSIARAMSLPQKRRGGRGKLPLRELLGRRLPASIAERPKHGFRVPLTSWFRGELSSLVHERLLSTDRPAAGLLPVSAVQRLVDQHMSGAAEHSSQIWSLLALHTWMDRHGLK